MTYFIPNIEQLFPLFSSFVSLVTQDEAVKMSKTTQKVLTQVKHLPLVLALLVETSCSRAHAISRPVHK